MKLLGGLLAVGLLTGCPNKSRNESVKALNDGVKAHGLKQFDTAIERCEKATQQWRDNHKAWYCLGAALRDKKDYAKAASAFEKAVQIVGDDAMYQMLYGITLYEKAAQAAREDQATRQGVKPEQVEVDLSSVPFEKALQHLKDAIKLNGELWRAHYYIGRIYRDNLKSKEAAESLTKALTSAPPEPAPWIALSELYRKWDYTDAALQVAEEGIKAVQTDQSDLWYVIGASYEDKGLYDKAITAYDKSLSAKPDNKNAKFQRGQAYFRKGDFTNAKRDLEEYSKAAGKSGEFNKQQASRMLMDIAAKSATDANASGAGAGGAAAPGTPNPKLSPEDLVKQNKKKK